MPIRVGVNAGSLEKDLQKKYGATSPKLTPPLTSNKEIHYRGISCSPCFEKKCKYGHYDCLVEIQADDVFKSFK